MEVVVSLRRFGAENASGTSSEALLRQPLASQDPNLEIARVVQGT